MAKAKVNRSQAIRDYYKDNPESKPKMISDALKVKGIKVKPQYISVVLLNARKKSSKSSKKRGRKAGVSGSSDLNHLLLVKKLVKEVGSIDDAKQAIATYAQLMA